MSEPGLHTHTHTNLFVNYWKRIRIWEWQKVKTPCFAFLSPKNTVSNDSRDPNNANLQAVM